MKKEKSILFHYSILNVGGAERSLLRLMRYLSDKGWNVFLVLTAGGGTLEDEIDPRVHVYHLRSIAAGNQFKGASTLLGRIINLSDLCLYGITRIEEYIKSIFLFSKYRFDAAAISLHGLSPKFVCRFIRAKCRIQWIRNDLLLCDSEQKAQNNITQYKNCLDHFVCVSQTAERSLNTLFPELQDRTSTVYNIIAPEEMKKLAEDGKAPEMENNPSFLKVVTVCRLSDKAKGLLRMVSVHSRLNQEGIDFQWFIVGDGPDKEKMQIAINKAGLTDKMILLGSRENPFPYYKNADISATLSYYEGLCGAVNEAKVIGKPVIATEFSGIYEQIEDGETGIIVANNEESIFNGMRQLLCNSELREKLSCAKLPKEIMDDGHKIDKLIEIIEGRY